MTYKIKLRDFEGPFDLLLFFIERDELDIYDIPIAQITNDFLGYIRELEQLNIDVASEFILVAATLMQIKARMLLPRQELDAQGNEIDPRQELVERLLEYQRYKTILEELTELEHIRLIRYERGNIVQELQLVANQAMTDAELENLTLFRLLKTYEQVLLRFKEQNEKVVHTVVRYHYTMEERREFVLKFLQKYAKTDFQTLFLTCENRLHAIFTFLAILELLQQEQIQIVVGEGFNSFELASNTLI